MLRNKKIVFMGTPDYATAIFTKLLEENYTISALFTQPDKPVGRKQQLQPPHIKKFCLEQGLSLPIYQLVSLKTEESAALLRELAPDIIIVAAYGQILPQKILDIAPCINLHASLLPKYRGASPIQQALLNGDAYTGVTAMHMDIGLDSGDILGYKYVAIDQDMLVAELFEKLSVCAAQLCLEVLEHYETLDAKKQFLSVVSHCKKITKKDGLVQFDDAQSFYNRYRAFHSWPDIYLESGLKIKECFLHKTTGKNSMGSILAVEKNSILVGCNEGIIEIISVQPASKKQMSVVDYIRGKRLAIGDNFS